MKDGYFDEIKSDTFDLFDTFIVCYVIPCVTIWSFCDFSEQCQSSWKWKKTFNSWVVYQLITERVIIFDCYACRYGSGEIRLCWFIRKRDRIDGFATLTSHPSGIYTCNVWRFGFSHNLYQSGHDCAIQIVTPCVHWVWESPEKIGNTLT